MTNKFKLFLKSKGQAGFTLIETLVAVLILVTAIAGPLTIASKGLNAALVAKDQITAFYLAQDAVEFVRYQRDTGCLAAGSPCASANWLSRLSICTSTNGCYIDSTKATNPITPCGPGCPNLLKYDITNHLFSYSAGSATTFTRSVVITPSADEAILTVMVSWTDIGGITHPPVKVVENLFNWE
ncbi:MAG TPA: prepilin-type N-terminal cleavage/methylation domain-containing protein [Candidatus Paceibacterota bacterium]|nr:prepilin-type N-terminal cleavage/methylation domain-containing protein [Candidatus Paceibacterota bacterium]